MSKYSKLSSYDILIILTKAFNSYYESPTDKNHFFWRNKKILNQFLDKRKNVANQFKLKTKYKQSLSNFKELFDNQNNSQFCKITKYNLFPFLLIMSNKWILELNLKNSDKIQNFSYIKEFKKNIDKIAENIKNKERIIKITTTHQKQLLKKEIEKLTEEKKEKEEIIEIFERDWKTCLDITIQSLFLCCRNNKQHILNDLNNLTLDDKINIFSIILLINYKKLYLDENDFKNF